MKIERTELVTCVDRRFDSTESNLLKAIRDHQLGRLREIPKDRAHLCRDRVFRRHSRVARQLTPPGGHSSLYPVHTPRVYAFRHRPRATTGGLERFGHAVHCTAAVSSLRTDKLETLACHPESLHGIRPDLAADGASGGSVVQPLYTPLLRKIHKSWMPNDRLTGTHATPRPDHRLRVYNAD